MSSKKNEKATIFKNILRRDSLINPKASMNLPNSTILDGMTSALLRRKSNFLNSNANIN